MPLPRVAGRSHNKLCHCRNDLGRRENHDAGKPRKIARVQCEDVRQAVGHHKRDQPCIMGSNTYYATGNRQRPPTSISGWSVRKNMEQSFDDFQPSVSFSNVQTMPSPRRGGTRAYVPKLRRVLWRRHARVATLTDQSYGFAYIGVHRVGTIEETQQDARIGEDQHQS